VERPGSRPTLQETRPQVDRPPGGVRAEGIRRIPRSHRLTAPNTRRATARRHALRTIRRHLINRRLRHLRLPINLRLRHLRPPTNRRLRHPRPPTNRRLRHPRHLVNHHLRRRPHLRHPINRRRLGSPQSTLGQDTATATRTTTTPGLPDIRGGAKQVCLVADCERLDQPLAAATSAPVTEKPARAQMGSNWCPAWSSSSVRARSPLRGSR
jgi:hypothetical protein